MTKKYIFFFLLLCGIKTNAQKIDSVSIRAYIQQYKAIAIEEMNRTGIPASITLAQGIHESGFGKSFLAQKTNNHFGIKCHESWTGKTFKYTDDAPNECFRVYDKVEDSYVDHSAFLTSRPRYASLFLLEKTDYKGWAFGLKEAGYATNPKYPQIIIKTIEDFQLDKYDKEYNNQLAFVAPKTAIVEKKTANTSVPKATPIIRDKIKIKSSVQKEKPAPIVYEKRKTIVINKRKAIKFFEKETLEKIQNITNVADEKLLIFNDVKQENQIPRNQYIFIQRKKRKNKKEPIYKVKEGDNIWSISQKKGIRLASLLKRNKLKAGEEPAAKQLLYLSGKTKHKPILRTVNSLLVNKKDSTLILEREAITRTNDTVYPVIQEPIKAVIDSNKMIDWEEDKKLLETSVPIVSPKQDSINKPIILEEKIKQPTPVVSVELPKTATENHTVVKGDTMYNIAKRYAVSIQQIMLWNKLTSPNIKLGQTLKIRP